jgi:hypothetical protein
MLSSPSSASTVPNEDNGAERGASLPLQHVPPLDGFGLCDPGMVQARCGDLANDYAQGFSIFADRSPQPL